MDPSDKSAARFYALPKVHKDHVLGEVPPGPAASRHSDGHPGGA